MLRNGVIPLAVHELLEPFIAALLIAAPFLFGFSDQGAATAVFIALGVLVLLIGQSTDWRISVIKIIPLPVHFVLDLVIGVLLIISPFLFGFSDQAAPTALAIVLGAGSLLIGLGTRFDPAARLSGHAAS